MKFILDAEQRLFGETLDKILTEADTPSVIRGWAAGVHEPGLALWRSLAETGVLALAVPESAGGAGPLPVELVTAFHELGRHAVPGPYAETVAVATLLDRLGDELERGSEWLEGIAEGRVVASLALPTLPALPAPAQASAPYALDADAADLVLLVDGDALRAAAAGEVRASLDPARRLPSVVAGDVLAAGPSVAAAARVACDMGVLATAAQLVGVGRRLLEVSVDYAKARQQFGRPIGEFQAVKHHLADALVGLEYARPLVHGAAVSYGSPDFGRDVSAAKVAASEAAYAAAKIALQVHGAIGYTDEYDPSLWIRKARALHSAWGSPAAHRARVISSLAGA
ncbi:acyl-CoA dehydrogenase family protein [Sphaerimonospora thailandensis]|uniref:Putative acyl-CoA dehydrogenase FadE n=1 Tax=Sphaerimonospora thailandensis TaxID=795644 RepID=A0A8J3W1K3_9ACTN|nr:acyl-CoA dehydrogenase family protein [Sphaerimonospora thailandensis]GIH72857.1 putative acyl-CoA dehydrogenase FadE [Sphaerimonospora thailandensis]